MPPRAIAKRILPAVLLGILARWTDDWQDIVTGGVIVNGQYIIIPASMVTNDHHLFFHALVIP
jgi:hypothetical protein